MAKDWIMVRLERATHRQLQEVRAQMEHADALGQIDLTRDDRDRVSLDQVIARLIAFRERHAERRRRSAARRRGSARNMELVDANIGPQGAAET